MEFHKEQDLLIIRLDDGERVIESIKTAMEQSSIDSGIIITGLGMMKSIDLGFFTFPKERGNYLKEEHRRPYEVIALSGTIADYDKKVFPHIHVGLGKEDLSVIGGHLIEATVNATLEIAIQISAPLVRIDDELTGLTKLIPGKHR